MIPFTGKYTTANVMIDDIDAETQAQIIKFVNHPAFTERVVVMPDCHAGKGAVIGFTMPLPSNGVVIPAIVGVDINCGMLLIRFFSKELGMSREKFDELVRRVVPTGTNVHEIDNEYFPEFNMERNFPWKKVSRLNAQFCMAYEKRFGTKMEPTEYTYEWFLAKCDQVGMNSTRAERSVGTLGGSNHFIEIGRSDVTGELCLTIHTGSRQFGKCVGEYWQKVPSNKNREEVEKKFEEGLKEIKAAASTKAQRREIPSKIKKLKTALGLNDKSGKAGELDHLEGEDARGYLTDMLFASVYADMNRVEIATAIHSLGNLLDFATVIESVHNFIDFNDFIIRKGAITAYPGEKMIIPFNMEDGLLICKGKGNSDWNYSAPHGAGRVWPRSKANKMEGLEDRARKRLEDKNVYVSVLPKDETKDSYKDPKIIEEAIEPTAKIIERIKPVLTIKGD